VNSQVSAFPGMELATGVSAALWLPGRLWPHHGGRVRVGECVPEGYPAYGRLLHPAASTDPGGPERWRWADIAAKRNYHLGPELRFNDLVGWDVSATADPLRYPSAAATASNHPMIPEHGKDRVKEVAMTRRVRLWITAVLTMAAMALMVGLAVAAHAGVNQAHPNPPLAGLTFNGID
jgi:hypothetical protein